MPGEPPRDLFSGIPLPEPLEGRPGSIDPRTLARTTDPPTSREAAALHVRSGVNARQAREVLAAVRKFPGRTSAELAELTGINRHITGRRLPELERRGLITRGPARLSLAGGRRGLTWYPTGFDGPGENEKDSG